MTILLTGGSSVIRSRLVACLAAQKCSMLLASKMGLSDDKGNPGVVLDWHDQDTWNRIFDSDLVKTAPIKAIYLSIMGLEDGYDTATAFVNLARDKGVNRFVFQTNFMLDEDGSSWYSKVHSFLQSSGVEWAVLRPSWYMQTFSEEQRVQPVKLEHRIVSATGNGRVPFVDCEDVAAVAAQALTRSQSFDRDLMVLGPESLSYADIANILTAVLGYTITNSQLSSSDMAAYLHGKGCPISVANLWAEVESRVAQGAEIGRESDIEMVLGRPACTFKDFATRAKHLWEN